MRAVWLILAGFVGLVALAMMAPTASADPPTPDGQATLSLSAALNGAPAALTGGLRWRLFDARADDDGAHALIVESDHAQPTLTVPPGDYVVHVAFGLASATKRMSFGPEVRSERLALSAGGLRIGGAVADTPIDPV